MLAAGSRLCREQIRKIILMSKSDRGVIAIMLLLVLLYLAVWATGYFIHQFAFFAAGINIIAGIAIIGYWVIRQM